MRPTHSVPPDNGSRRSLRCPPSHPLMVLPSHLAQASAQMARPSGPSTHAASMGRVSPLLHQLGSTTYCPPTTTTMEGEYGPTAAPLMPSAQASPPDRLAKGRGGNAIAELGSPFNASSVLSLPPTPNHGGDSRRVNGTLACYHRGGNAIAKLSPSFLANLVFSHPLSTNNGGEHRLGGRPCYGTQSPAFGICHVYTPRIR
jgi:hypothetical protein